MPDRSTPDRRAAVLRVAPWAIPAVRAALHDAASEVGRHLARSGARGYLGEAWLGDETSAAVRDLHNRRVMEAADGPCAALVADEAELWGRA